MPEISRFYGIIIKIFLTREHNPPHFHAVYGEFSGLFDIQTLEMFEGDLPPKAQGLIKEWAELYKTDIENMCGQLKFLKSYRLLHSFVYGKHKNQKSNSAAKFSFAY